MAIVQSEIAKGTIAVPQAFTSGAVVAYRASYTFPAGETLASGDIVELGVLPADHEFVTATLIPEGDFGTATANVGLMTGDVGSDSDERTSGDEVFQGVALTGFASVDSINPFTEVEKSEVDRSIGVTFSEDVVGDGQTFTVLVVMNQ